MLFDVFVGSMFGVSSMCRLTNGFLVGFNVLCVVHALTYMNVCMFFMFKMTVVPEENYFAARLSGRAYLTIISKIKINLGKKKKERFLKSCFG